VFASPYKDGQVPYWPDSALTDFVRPAATRAGITKRVGWHTFRHTYSTHAPGQWHRCESTERTVPAL